MKRTIYSAVVIVLSIAGFVLPASPALADGTCDRTDATLNIDLEGSGGIPFGFFRLSRDGGGQINLEEVLGFPFGTTDIDCGDASVENVDRIEVRGSNGDEDLLVDIENGGFAPGDTPEDPAGDSEIEVDIRLGRGADMAIVEGTPAPETFRMGTQGVNLNADGDGDDVVFHQSVEQPGLFGGDDDDVLTATGGSDTGSASLVPVILTGGLGNDTLRGGRAGDLITGQIGDDLLVGGDGNDHLGANMNNVSAGFANEDGEDTLKGGKGGDTLRGGKDEDRLNGGRGDDEEHGGEGNDVFLQGARPNGSDDLFGGEDADVASYRPRRGTVMATLDGNANDGAPGEHDSVGLKRDIEGLTGGRRGDRLIGNGKLNILKGRGGPDFLNGRGGADFCDGGSGNDTLVNCNDPT